MRGIVSLSVLGGLCLLLWGCGPASQEALPETAQVTGTVKYKNGQPVPGGMIEFTSPNAKHTMLATIQPDGSFAVKTLGADNRTEGAPPGQYKVTITPPMGQSQDVQPINLPDTYEVKAGTENVFHITLKK